MPHRAPIAAMFLLGISAASGQTTQQWVRTVYPPFPAPRPGTATCVVLDPMIFAFATPGLRDLRLMQDGVEIPYAIEESFDNGALAPGADPARDRSQYQTVSTLTLQSAGDQYGGRIAYGWIPSHVPIERVLFQNSAGTPEHVAQGSLHMELVAGTGSALPYAGNPGVEVVRADLPLTNPAEVTALGANLQKYASVVIRTGPASAAFDSVALQMRRRSLCFQPRSAGVLELYYGSADPQLRQYAFAAHFHPPAVTPLATMGPQRTNPLYKPPPVRKHWGRRRWLALAGMAVLLPGLFAAALLRNRFE